MPKDMPLKVIPPLSVVEVTSTAPEWKDEKGKIFRIGYYSQQDGLDCVWLVDDTGDYGKLPINNTFGITSR